jgi:hypothetical protein
MKNTKETYAAMAKAVQGVLAGCHTKEEGLQALAASGAFVLGMYAQVRVTFPPRQDAPAREALTHVAEQLTNLLLHDEPVQ